MYAYIYIHVEIDINTIFKQSAFLWFLWYLHVATTADEV